MGLIPDEDIERVRDANDIVELAAETVVLRQRGSEFWGCCPFHQEKTPSFKVNPATQLWHCFGCSTGGDVFKYIMSRENIEFPDAVRYLAERKGVEIHEGRSESGSRTRKTRLIEVCESSLQFYHRLLMRDRSKGAQVARDYLASRGMGSEICKRWLLGYAPGNNLLVKHLFDNGYETREMIEANVAVARDRGARDRFYDRIMFPIYDELGRAIAFGGRILGSGEPKYLNSQETPVFHKSKNLYAMHIAKEHIVAQGNAILVEGYTDVIAMHEAGIKHTVATLGTALTAEHVKLLSRFTQKITLLFDGDAAGLEAAERAMQYLNESKADLFCVVIPDGKDPADLITAAGKTGMIDLLDTAVPLTRFVVDKRLASWDLSYPEQRSRALNDALTALAPLKGTLLADEYCEYLASMLDADPQIVKQGLKNLKVPTPRVIEQKSLSNKTGLDGQDNHVEGLVEVASGIQRDGSSRTVSTKSGPTGKTVALEREILALLAAHPEVVKRYEERIAGLEWADPRHESIAWAMLATPAQATSAEVVEAARNVSRDSDEILASGRVMSLVDPELLDASTVLFLDELELADLERRILRGKALLKTTHSVDAQRYDSTFEEVSQLQRRVVDLKRKMRNKSMDA